MDKDVHLSFKNKDLSETQKRFKNSDATIVLIMGPQGEGKTYAGLAGLFKHVLRQEDKRMRCAIIRDKHTNIKRHTVPSIAKATRYALPFTYDDRRWVVKSNDFTIDCDLFGMMDLGSVTNLQGAEYDLIWCEEPAPVIQTGNDGIREEHFNMMVARCSSRSPGRKARLQITMNPPEEDHWTYHRLIEHPDFIIPYEKIEIPYGENKYVDKETREQVKDAFKHDPGMYMRFVEGKPAFTLLGEKVVPNYDDKKHRSQVILNPIPGVEVIRGWDGGHWPTVVFMQIDPRGRLLVLDTIRGEHIGVKQLIDYYVRPLMENRYKDIPRWLDFGDHTMATSAEADITLSAACVIEKEFNTVFYPGPTGRKPQIIAESLRQLCDDEVDGMPKLCISAHEGVLHRALRGGWHYTKDPSGKVIKDKPQKDIHSHPGDAFGNAVARLFGKTALSLGELDPDSLCW